MPGSGDNMILQKEKAEKMNVAQISEYQFQSLDDGRQKSDKSGLSDGNITTYHFEDLRNKIINSGDNKTQKMRVERKNAAERGFEISPIVSKQRGLLRQAEEEREQQIQEEVARRVAELEQEAQERGFEEGVQRGREEVFKQTKASTEEKITALSEMISIVLNNYGEILKRQKLDIYKMVKNLTKWIILRELKDDGKYLIRLLEKLILEVQSRSNLLIQVNQKDFEKMPEVLKVVQEKLGELSNVRLEIGYDIDGSGIVVDSENGIVNASMAEQFDNLDKLFTSVGIDE
ncbi:MAG: hypothetical protein A2451_10300 [Bdellovibrionales bacterium RIFOXYC2_FULL_39_8]|nr:MAG: hypothetical protein A2451_10300 [Bdellovibrionales bacterium RIFOXYC2_FULL_39_8]